MAKQRYKIVGIAYPGKVDLYPYGTLNLCDQSDERLAEIKAKTNCQFIQPTVDAPAITIKETAKKQKKPTQKRE